MKPGQQPGRKATRNRPPIKHSKTFSGCWTCRSRHVKCDEARPACARCLRGGFDCQGYGVRLVWNPDNPAREQNIRRAIGNPAIYDDESPFKQVDVHEALEEIEQLSAEGNCLSRGPFSVFAVHGSRPKPDIDEATLSAAYPAGFVDDINHHGLEPVSASPFEIDVSVGGGSGADDEIETIVSPFIVTPSSPVQDYDSMLQHRRPSDVMPLSIRHFDLLPRPSEQRALVHHWTNFVCWHLVPVDRPDNPFRSVFTPMALAGLSLPSNQSNGQVALFHALCATAAFSRGQLLNHETNSLTLAMKHYNLAIMHLRHSLASLEEHPSTHEVDLQRASILATITMFSAMDMITGRSNEWRTHLQGGASWLSTIEDSAWNRDKSSSMVYQGYLAIAALCNINLPSTIDVESEDFLADTRHYVLDRFFGLTRPILKHIVLTNSLIKRISTASSRSPSAQEIDKLESQLYAQSPLTLDLSSQDLTPLAHSLTLHHAYVFYYASLIHFHRTIRHLPPGSPTIQALVASAVGHLEDIETLGGESIGCTLVWPPFIVACECVDEGTQQKMLSWYMCKRRHGFMNLEMSKDIAREVWRRRTIVEDDTDVKWQDVLREMKLDIVLA
ncbi:hypothetical protein G647_08938 [Cladophialophora carrionii CBS 160.54]|uniref:Zn(2)-C6 fungal-type domain-containing protein n=1 Tax=Cladophialophora carrionii CBS 160.54 TaxID=1279043 RepID=V9D0Y4_9EURO|nr:uncharacterized protein G647_08938 [Cladophialophora carrionii CBS 160.54]ETI19923.1 hypothetical protein G647_08938 [Cladophialophora carrionii CBS 160.54]